jgi:hypothetical protein
VFVIAASGSPWARRRRIKLADLINEPWALPPPDNLAHGWATDAFRAAGLEPPRPAMITTTGVARIALVAKGRFLTIASETVLRFGGWESAIRVLPIDLATKAGAVGIIKLKNRTLTPVAKLFMDCAREVAKPMAMPRRRQPQKARIWATPSVGFWPMAGAKGAGHGSVRRMLILPRRCTASLSRPRLHGNGLHLAGRQLPATFFAARAAGSGP